MHELRAATRRAASACHGSQLIHERRAGRFGGGGDENVRMALTFLLIARLPAGGTAAFEAYESAVLPLLAEHGGRLERRLRSDDDRVEAHVVSFPGEAEAAAYRADPRRTGVATLLAASGAELELLTVRDLPLT